MGGKGSGKPAGYGKSKGQVPKSETKKTTSVSKSVKTNTTKTSSSKAELEKKYGKVIRDNDFATTYEKTVSVKADKISKANEYLYGKNQLSEQLNTSKGNIEYDKDSGIFTHYTGYDPSKKGNENKPTKVFYKVDGATMTKTTKIYKDGKTKNYTDTDFYSHKGNKLKFKIVGTKQ